MNHGWFDRNIKWMYTLPGLFFILIMMAFPILYTFRMSFYHWSMSSITPPKWAGIDNYIALFTDERFWNAMKATFYFTSVALTVEVVLGLACAVLINRSMLGKNVVKTIFLLPMVATPVAMGLVWMLIYEPSMGAANMLLKVLGLEPQLWLGSINQVIPSLIIIDVWQWTPMVALILMAGLRTLPMEPYEAADMDGASSWRKFVSITLPLLKPTIIVTTMLRLIDVLKTFDIIYATTQGGPGSASETLNLFGYVLGFQYFKLGQASALLVIFFAVVMGFTLLMLGMKRRLERVS